MLKKIVLITLTGIICATTSFAQKYISIGPTIGYGHCWVTNGDLKNNFSNGKINTGYPSSYNIGLSVIYAKNEHWGFGGDILYSRERFKKNFQYLQTSAIGDIQLDYDLTQRTDYLRIPLRAYYFFGHYPKKLRPKIYLGPSLGFAIGSKAEVDANNSKTYPSTIHPFDNNQFDLGIQIGAGANILLGKAMWLNVDINYYQGFLDALKDQKFSDWETGTNWNQNVNLQIGFLFGLEKLL